MTSTNSFLSLEESSSQVFTDFVHFAIIFQPFLPIVPGHLCVLPGARCQCPHCLSRMGQKTESAPHKGWASARAENAKGNCRASWDEALPLATSTNLQHPAAPKPRCRSREASWPASGRYAAPGELPHLPQSEPRTPSSSATDEPCSLPHPRLCICSASFGRLCLTLAVVALPSRVRTVCSAADPGEALGVPGDSRIGQKCLPLFAAMQISKVKSCNLGATLALFTGRRITQSN